MTKRPIGTESLPIFDALIQARTAEVVEEMGLLAPRSRASDPQTSHDAGASMREEAANQRAAILALLESYPPGLCADRLDEALGFRDGRAGKRCPELCEQGLAVLCEGKDVTLDGRTYHIPELRQQTRSGRWACIVLAKQHIDLSWLTTEGAQ